mgnify:CR=1 FL=1
MPALKLPENFRDIAHASALRTLLGPGSSQFSHVPPMSGSPLARNVALVDRICDRAERLSKAGLLVGDSPTAVANVIYGGWWLWMFVWTNRALLWQIINLLASLVFQVAKDGRVVHTTVAG